jgi:hypothetical protein
MCFPDIPPDGPREWDTVFAALTNISFKPRAEMDRCAKEDHAKSPEGDEAESKEEAGSKLRSGNLKDMTLMAIRYMLEKSKLAIFTVDGDCAQWPQSIPSAEHSIPSREEYQTTQEEDRLLSQLLLDLQLLDYGKKRPEHHPDTDPSSFGLTLEDVFIMTLRPIWTERLYHCEIGRNNTDTVRYSRFL